MDGEVNIEAYIKSLEQEYQPRALAAAAHELYLSARYCIAQAQEPGMCPRLSSTLADSDVVEEPVIDGYKISVTFGFNTNYAAAVHEILTNVHPNGQAKYLEKPVTEFAPQLPGRLMAAIEAAVSS